MRLVERIARISWIAGFFLSLPVAFLCLIADAGLLYLHFHPYRGPDEFEPISQTQFAIGMASAIAFPAMWILGFLFGHRFNLGWRATLPFLSLLIPAGALAWPFYAGNNAGMDRDLPWIFPYFVILVSVLTVGLVSAILCALKRSDAGHDPITPPPSSR